MDLSGLMNDLEAVKNKHSDCFVQVNNGTLKTLIVITPEMVQLQKLYGKTLLISVSKKRKNKYDFYTLLISGINNYGHTVVMALAFLNVKAKESYAWILRSYSDKMTEEGNDPQPNMVVVPLENEALDAVDLVFKDKKPYVIANQFSFLMQAKDILSPYKKRMNFDHVLAQ